MGANDKAISQMLGGPAAAEQDPLWYKDAVIYQVHVKSFFDANNDGVGDFAGLIAKLDYIAGLGVTCVWLLPFYPSPRRDDGYDIAEYRGVHPTTARWPTRGALCRRRTSAGCA
jgi:maltose alpha-D-glucosyltransferase/alpha-amylase